MSIDEIFDTVASQDRVTYTWLLIDAPATAHPCFAACSKEVDPVTEGARAFWAIVDGLSAMHPGARPVIVWDPRDNAAMRRATSPCYKFNRLPKPPGFRECMALIYRAARDAREYAQVSVPGYEADDAIASFVRTVAPDTVLVVSSDQDLHQLISPRVQQWHPNSKQFCDTAVVAANGEYTGYVHTRRKAIKGDAGDNVRGLAGVGDAAADAVLSEYPEFVERCLVGDVDWGRLSCKSIDLLVRAGAASAHPVRAPKFDTRECRRVDALRAVCSLVRDTHRAVALEDGLDVWP